MQKPHKPQRLALAAAPRPVHRLQPHRGHGRARAGAGGVAVQRVLLAERLLAPHLPRGARRQRADVPGAGPQGLHRAGI